MAAAEFQFDTRIRRFHVPIVTQQHRLRHLRSVAARNIIVDTGEDVSNIELFYSLHQKPDSEAFYTSEIIVKNLSPSWKHFEPNGFPEHVNISSPYITVKLWNSKNGNKLLLEWVVFFSGLNFLGIQIPKEGKNFKPNTLLFGMLEGFYGCSDCQQHPITSESEESLNNESIFYDLGCIRNSYASSTLGRIKTIERAVKQTQATASRRRKSIESRLQDAEKLQRLLAEREFLKIKMSMLKLELQYEQSNLIALQKNAAHNQQEYTNMQVGLKTKYEDLERLREKILEMGKGLWEMRENLLKTEAHLTYRRKELISELCTFYPIVEFPDHTGFSINSVHLPNSENLLNHEEKMISIALGYVCHVVLMISQFINVPLRYAIHFGGSRSTVIDHISSVIPVKSREFPLNAKGNNKRLFEYGVYLLNKDIAQLRVLCGLATKDLSATLPNLHNLIDLKFSLTSEMGPTSSLKTAMLSRGSSEESSKLLSEPQPQNGLTHSASTANSINVPVNHSQISNTEVEYLKKEMAEMMPSDTMCSKDTCILPRRIPNEVSTTLSCSLDKGLNDIKVFESSHIRSSKNERKLQRLTFKMKKIGETYHHSSYPNLNSSLCSVNNSDSITLPSGSPQFQTGPLKMWMGGSSHTNSEEETFNDINIQLDVPAGVPKDSGFYLNSKMYNGAEGDTNVTKLDPIQHDRVFEIEKAMLDQQDFCEDLALRTEQLASRSSSFQMQRLNSSSSDLEQMHI